MKLIYVLVALVVLLAFLEMSETVVEGKKELEAVGAFKSYVEQARAAGMIGSQPPDSDGVSLPSGYSIVVNGDFVELHDAAGVVMSDGWR